MSSPVVTESGRLPLPVVDALDLRRELRDVLQPGQLIRDATGQVRRLPRFFYEVESWAVARELRVTADFMLWEFLTVDVREALAQRSFPRYVPCAITVLAAHLQLFRNAAGTTVHVATNGGYRSPAHRLSRPGSTHCWGVAANIYRIGDAMLDAQERIERYAAVAREAVPGVWIRPYGIEFGQADDHLHLDMGYIVSAPRGAGSEEER